MLMSILNDQPDFNRECFRESPLAVDFIKRCLVKDPAKRDSASVLLKHPWLEQMNENSIVHANDTEFKERLAAVSANILKNTVRFSHLVYPCL